MHRVSGFFEGRDLVIATMHGKERAIGPALEGALGVRIRVAQGLNTDAFGTFTGEIERQGDARAAARAKCHAALAHTGCDLAVATEGSFGPHPTALFLPAHEELICLLDARNGIEIVAVERALETNYLSAEVTTHAELEDFARRALFPSHALILRRDAASTTDMIKGITDPTQLTAVFSALLAAYGRATVETDMRAHLNPTRMSVLGKAVNRLVEKVASTCPTCDTPGFDVSGIERGLPCRVCTTPTSSILSYTYMCRSCSFCLDVRHPHGLTVEDPRHCPRCNP